jgi:hypothetical protein
MSPPKEERRLCGATFKTAEVPQTYYILLPLQVGRGQARRNREVKKRSRDPFHQQDERCCVCWGVVVTNRSLGGFDGRSTLSGRLWCLSGADYASQLLLRFGDVVR